MTTIAKKSAGLDDVGFWTRFWARITGRPRLEAGESFTPFDTYTSQSGATVSADTALRLSAVWACVGLRADTIASLPIHIKRSDRTFADDHALTQLLRVSPNYDMTPSEFFAAMVASMDLWGNAYAVISRASGRIASLTPLNPERVTVRRSESGDLIYRYAVGDKVELYQESEILHFKGFTLDGLVGLSPIQYAAETMGGLISANDAAGREFKNSLKIGGFLKTGVQALRPEQREQIRANLSTFGLPENAGKWMVLEAGMDVAGSGTLRMKPSDAQLLESRYFGIEEICRAFRVPPPLIGHTDKASSWASSISNLNQGFLTYSIRPTLVRMEQTMAKKLLTPSERKDLAIKFNFRGLLRGNFSEQMTGYVQGLNAGVYSIDEVRDLEDYPPLPDGKGTEHRAPLNMAPVGTEQQE